MRNCDYGAWPVPTADPGAHLAAPRPGRLRLTRHGRYGHRHDGAAARIRELRGARTRTPYLLGRTIGAALDQTRSGAAHRRALPAAAQRGRARRDPPAMGGLDPTLRRPPALARRPELYAARIDRLWSQHAAASRAATRARISCSCACEIARSSCAAGAASDYVSSWPSSALHAVRRIVCTINRYSMRRDL